MKTLIITIFLFFNSFMASAVENGTYACSANAGWEHYTLTVKKINLDSAVEVPYVVYTKDLTQISGIATVRTTQESESLYLNQLHVITFGADKSTGDCTIKN